MAIAKNKKFLIKAYLVFIGLFFSYDSLCQENKLDSIIFLINDSHSLSDSTLFSLLIEVSRNHANLATRINYALQAQKLGEKYNNDVWLRQSYLGLGYAYKLDGQIEKSLKCHLKALEYATSLNDKSLEASSYNAIAGVYRLQENYSLSLEYYHRAINIFTTIQDTLRLATSLMNVGELFRFIKKHDSTLILTKIAEKHFSNLKHKLGVAYCFGNIGLSYAELGKIDSAEIFVRKAVTTFKALKKPYPISAYLISLADIYAQKGESLEALKFAQSALSISEDEGLKEQIRDASLKLSELYQAQGDYRKAYDYQSQYITYRDSINNEEVIRKMADLRTEYEVGQKQAEVDLKQTEVDLLNEQARNNQIVLWSVIVVLVLVLCLTYALLKVYRVKSRAVRIVRQRRRVIAAQRDQLEDVNRTKDKFFSIISHDIRGPISNFQGVSQLIHLLVESKDYDGLLKLGTMLDTSTKEVSSLLDNLLEWAMSQQGRMPYKPETIKLHELCNSNLSIMENLATAKQITLTEKVKEKVTLTADKNSVSTIIRNLLSNGIKFTPEGGKVDLQLTYDLNMAVLTVKDSGIGIPKEKMEHLFDFKGERSRWGTGGEKGVGLGLTLVHEFVELNKGKIEVESEEGKGTTFKVYLPLLSE